MLKTVPGRGFDAMYRELISLHPELKEIVLERVNLFKNSPDDTRLKNHPLKRRLSGKWAFCITGDINSL